jgi:hypothetical protein
MARQERIATSIYLRKLIKLDYDNHQRARKEQREIDKLVSHLAEQELTQ